MNNYKCTLSFGFYSSILLVILTIITWGLGMIAIPPSGPNCPANCIEYPFDELLLYYPRDYYWMYMAVIQLFSYVIFMVSNHFVIQSENKLFSFLSITFTIIASTVLLIDYFVQFAVVPLSVMNGETEGIALLTQYNGHGIFIAMEELGYICMSISFLFMSFVFKNESCLEKSIKIILITGFILLFCCFVFYVVKYGLDRSYRFEVAAISVNWITAIIIGILMSILSEREQ